MERLTLQFVFKGQMAAEGLWESESEPGHRYVKLLPGAAGAVLWQIWPAVQVLALGPTPPHLWTPSPSGECQTLSLQEGLGVVRVDPASPDSCCLLCRATQASPGASLGIHPVYEGR